MNTVNCRTSEPERAVLADPRDLMVQMLRLLIQGVSNTCTSL
jgi:hypothetical protein